MSATRDKSQNIAFVYSNIYQLYKKAQAKPEMNARIFRADELGSIQIKKFEPKKLEKNPVDDLKSNINRLQDLHSKLRFMLAELEDLVKDKK